MSDAPRETHEASRGEKLRHIEELGIDPWGQRFDNIHSIGQVRALNAAPFDQGDGPVVRIAGRVRARRIQGKGLHFIDLWDQTGQVQVMANKKQLTEIEWRILENLDLGDLLGVDGEFGLTRTGERTVRARAMTFLGKSLEPHPDKWAGMQDVEYRLRHRYLDLIYSPETLQRARLRIQILRRIRRELDDVGFMEVETPVLHAVAGGAAARPFVTHHNTLDIDLYLRIALELHLKRLLVGGLEKVYEMGRVFRNEGISKKHNPEFTMLELYQAYGDYRTMMDLTERLIVAGVDEVQAGSRVLTYSGTAIDFTPPWPRLCYGDLMREHAGVDMFDESAVRAAAQGRGLDVAGRDREVLVHHLFETCVEPHLAGPVFVCDYPAGLCPLTKRNRAEPRVAERFELYVAGMELANAYTELNDPVTQEATFRRQLAGLREDESMARMDEEFIEALRYGMPPAGGLGIGIDRLVMLLTDATHIGDVILFPLLRPNR